MPDEPAHLAAGCLIAEFGKYDLYRVNPPFVKSVAGCIVSMQSPKYDWTEYNYHTVPRPEWLAGDDLFAANGRMFFWYLTTARWSLIPIWLIGLLIIRRWSAELGGPLAGSYATVLWAFSPDALAWSATLCADAPAASMGILCCWQFRNWLKQPTLQSAVLLGLAAGFCAITKTTLLILFPVFVVLVILHSPCRRMASAGHGIVAMVTGLLIVNCGYGFSGSCSRLDSLEFRSRVFCRVFGKPQPSTLIEQPASEVQQDRGRGGFCPPFVRLPLPRDFLLGMDEQQLDFEQQHRCYLWGKHRDHGVWYWYVAALAVKTPAALLVAALIALVRTVARLSRRGLANGPELPALTKHGQRILCESAILLFPALAILAFVSCHIGLTRHHRYVLPCYPFVFIWVAVELATLNSGVLRKVASLLVCWYVAGTVMLFPYVMSYFNEFAGGPSHGFEYLLDSGLDTGQDVHFLLRFLENHPEIEDLNLSLFGVSENSLTGLEWKHAPVDRRFANVGRLTNSGTSGPVSGWYAVSQTNLHSRTQELEYLNDFVPRYRIGYSIHIYYLSTEDVKGWQKKHPDDHELPQFNLISPQVCNVLSGAAPLVQTNHDQSSIRNGQW